MNKSQRSKHIIPHARRGVNKSQRSKHIIPHARRGVNKSQRSKHIIDHIIVNEWIHQYMDTVYGCSSIADVI